MMFAKKATLAAKSDLYRKFLAKKLLKDLPKYARNRWEDFDPDDALHYVGLTTYKPASSSFAGIGAFVIGCAVGGIAALLLTPKTGPELRTNVKDKAMDYLGKQGINVPEKTANA
ncbi:YtxH domain-containing protein [Cystobacter fuscus]|uniref:YtxH domain-containing protein n=1 Tax=Cystobacter fuscus TaxID=43 RepID=UPI002B301E6A|nr:YtxH domain-containing protein [Cystobacter fuscus]